jgi:hypothetical protein
MRFYLSEVECRNHYARFCVELGVFNLAVCRSAKVGAEATDQIFLKKIISKEGSQLN